MKRIFIIIGMLAAMSISSYAQKESNLWYFGHRAGLDFNNTQTINGISDIPTLISGPISTYEGCFSISDRKGNLLFVSDGTTVYDKNQNVMLGGTDLYGDLSSTNAGLVIPVPGSQTQYYIFTVPGREWSLGMSNNPKPGLPPPGLCYSIVDMSKNGKLGEVTQKNINIPLKGELNRTTIAYDKKWVAENITATGHSNGIDYWIVTRIKRYFLAYLVTAQGISETAVISDAIHDIDEVNKRPGATDDQVYALRSLGYIKLSPDGTRVAQCDYNSGCVTQGKFDNSTGAISDIKTSTFHPLPGPYGVEFSRDSKYIYIGGLQTPGICVQKVDVYNQYLTWSTTLGATPDFKVSTLQLASDGRIYGIGGASTAAAIPNLGTATRNLYLILNPDEGGTKSTILSNFFDNIYRPNFGLPPFITSFFGTGNIEIDPPHICVNQSSSYSIYVNPGAGVNEIVKLEWDFGDGTPIVTTSDMSQLVHTRQHTYSKLGKFIFKVTPYRADGSILTDKIAEKQIEVGRCSIPVNHNITNMGY